MDSNSKPTSHQALDTLFNEVGTYRTGTKLYELFTFIKKFPRIAPFNAMLLHIQKPGAQYVLTARDWKSMFDRGIKPEATPVVILIPFGPVQFVFDLGDTEGSDTFPVELLNPFYTEGLLSDKKFERLIYNLARTGVSYHEANHGAGSAGFIQPAEKESNQPVGNQLLKILYNLVVNGNHSQEEKFTTITHELGHLFCGHLGSPNPKWWPHRLGKEKELKEFEAESVAWLVCQRIGLKPPSAEYLSGYMGEDQKIPPISLETVLKASGKVESMLLRTVKIRVGLSVEKGDVGVRSGKFTEGTSFSNQLSKLPVRQ